MLSVKEKITFRQNSRSNKNDENYRSDVLQGLQASHNEGFVGDHNYISCHQDNDCIIMGFKRNLGCLGIGKNVRY